jgi:hypothetical protein
MAETNIKILEIRLDTGSGEIRVNGLKTSIEGLDKAFVKFGKSARKTQGDLKNFESSAGIAGATVNEFGRLISDLPFGITAITNNLSQFGSMFSILATKTGGARAAITSLMSTLSGPVGLLLAFQAAVAAIQFFEKELTNLISGNKELEEATKLSTIAIREQTKAIKENDDARLKSNSRLSFSIKLAKEFLKDIREGINSFEEEDIKRAENAFLALSKILTDANLKDAKFITDQKLGLEQRLQIAQSLVSIQRLSLQIAEEEDQLKEAIIKKDIEMSSFSKERLLTLNGQKKALEDQVKILSTPVMLSPEKDKKQKKEKDERFRFPTITIPKDEFGPQLDRFRKAFSLALKIEDEYNLKSIAGEENRAKEVVRLRRIENERKLALLETERKRLIRNGVSTIGVDQEIANKRKEIDLQVYEDAKEINRARIRDNQEVAEAILFGLNSITNFVDTEFQRQLDIEQNKTTAINNELRKRLDNENISKDERKNIQDQIAKNDEALRLKQEKIEKKRFQMNKAANIATATINTYLAATDVLAREKLGVVGKIAAMTLVIGAGLLQVAAIARQQFVSSASTAGGAFSGGSGGLGGVQAPDFNIVGASPSNQLAAAVQGQFQQPIKAYVVSKDVSTAQEMDRNIIGSASLG